MAWLQKSQSVIEVNYQNTNAVLTVYRITVYILEGNSSGCYFWERNRDRMARFSSKVYGGINGLLGIPGAIEMLEI